MLEAEVSIRDQVNRDLNCTETSVQLMAMRREMVSLIEVDPKAGTMDCRS